MNLIQIQDQLKGLPTQAIMGYANGQNPEVPPYVALAELNRRKQMQSGAMAGQGGQKPTIKDQITQSTGLMGLQNAQQQQSMQQVARAPQQGPVPQGAPEGPVQGSPEGFAGGGAIAFEAGGMPPDVDPNNMYIDTPSSEGGGDGISEWAKKIRDAREAKAAEEAGIAKLVRVPGRGFQMQGGEPPVAPAVNQTPEETARLLRQAQPTTATLPTGTSQSGLLAAIAQQQAPTTPPQTTPSVPAPAQLRQQINQGAPARPAQQGIATVMENTAAKMQPALVTAITEGLAKGQSIKESLEEYKQLNPVSKYQEMLANELDTSRKQELARRKTPENWVNNEGLMASLRGFAQADPRRPWGAGSAAGSAYTQNQIMQRAAEDAAYRQGLAGLAKSDEDRSGKAMEYGAGRLNAAVSAKNNAITAGTQMTDMAMRQAQSADNKQIQMAQIAESARDRAQRASDALAARGEAAKAVQVQNLLKQDESGLAKIEAEYPTMLRSSPQQLAAYNTAIAAHRSRMATAAKAMGIPGYEESTVAPAPTSGWGQAKVIK